MQSSSDQACVASLASHCSRLILFFSETSAQYLSSQSDNLAKASSDFFSSSIPLLDSSYSLALFSSASFKLATVYCLCLLIISFHLFLEDSRTRFFSLASTVSQQVSIKVGSWAQKFSSLSLLTTISKLANISDSPGLIIPSMGG